MTRLVVISQGNRVNKKVDLFNVIHSLCLHISREFV
jgi:hypothetical protein